MATKTTTTARRPSAHRGVNPKISSEAVKAKTGKTWAQWFAVLDKACAQAMSHKDIVAVLSKKHDVGPWWRQMVAVAYEQAKGLRAKHEKPDGFEITRSKTIKAAVDDVYEAWGNARRRAQWLPGAKLTIRKATENKTLRVTWGDGSNLEVSLYPKGPAKTQIAVQHGKLPSAGAAAKQKAFWGEAFDRLAQLLES
jgi:uncharacterized protein YndB with AHSA1/START domain